MQDKKRLYRPTLFSQVVGQEAIVQTLKNAIKKDRVANAYLFSGSHGTGKTTLARLFAKALNCKKRSKELEPCNQCANCHEIDHTHSIDVLEIDGASHRGIEDIRKINETCAFAPTSCHYKIYLIDEVHMLTKEAFNALLKTLEEPPENVKFFFATTEAHKLPKTILSRCQRFTLKRIPQEKIADKLRMIAKEQNIAVEEAALQMIARFAKGGLRDAESLFDQLTLFEEGKLTKSGAFSLLGLTAKELFFKLDHAELKKDLSLVFEIANHVVEGGKSTLYFLEELIEHYRTLLLLKASAPITFYDEEEKSAYQKSLALYSEEQLLAILQLLQEAQSKVAFSLSDKIFIEQILLKILQAKKTLSIETLVDRLLDLEKRLPSEEAKKKAPIAKKVAPLKEQSRYDSVVRFAAKELGGSLKG